MENSLRRTFRRLAASILGIAAVLLAGAVLDLAVTDPRLLTWAEVVPPDESLVGAVLPGGATLAVGLVVLARLRRIPDRLEAGVDGLTVRGGSGADRGVTPWSRVRFSTDPPGWEGVRIDLAGTGRPLSVWVSPSVADAVRLRRAARGAPSGPRSPER